MLPEYLICIFSSGNLLKTPDLFPHKSPEFFIRTGDISLWIDYGVRLEHPEWCYFKERTPLVITLFLITPGHF